MLCFNSFPYDDCVFLFAFVESVRFYFCEERKNQTLFKIIQRKFKKIIWLILMNYLI